MRRQLAARLLVGSGAASLIDRMGAWSGLLVLNYHRIGDGTLSRLDRGLWSATAEEFARQVHFLQRHADVVSVEDLPLLLERRHGRHVLITFDDGYRDNYDVAFPILRGSGLRAAFFVSTGYIDHPRLPWWDEIARLVHTSRPSTLELAPWLGAPLDLGEEEPAIRALLRIHKTIPASQTTAYLNALREALHDGGDATNAARDSWMTWDMLREMRAAGMTIGGHTVNHPNLGMMTADEQRQEISECGRRIREELGEAMSCFSYPIGNRRAFNADTRVCLRQAGVRYAFSYYGGLRRFAEWDDYDIRRTAIEPDVTFDLFRCLLAFPRLFAPVR